MLSQQLLGNERGQLTLYEGLASWQIYFYRINAWSNAQSSAGTVTAPNPVTGAAPSAKAALPTGVPAASR